MLCFLFFGTSLLCSLDPRPEIQDKISFINSISAANIEANAKESLKDHYFSWFAKNMVFFPSISVYGYENVRIVIIGASSI